MVAPAFAAPFLPVARKGSFRKHAVCTASEAGKSPCEGNRVRVCVDTVHPHGSLQEIKYGTIQHIGLLVEDTAVARRFYLDVLCMVDDHDKRNPELPFAGTFVRAGSSQIHLMELPSLNPKEGRPEHGGRDTHAAITVESLGPLIASLERHGIKYTFSKSGRRAVFLRDLDMNALEFIEL